MEAAEIYMQYGNTDIKMFKYKTAVQFYIHNKHICPQRNDTYQLQGSDCLWKWRKG